MKQLESFYKNKQVLVTGGAGFIGSHLVEKLVELGARVSVLDNFSTGNLNNLRSVLAHISLIYADVVHLHSVLKATAHKDFVFHLAAFASVTQSLNYADLCWKINVDGTRNVLEACHQNNVKTLVFSSSSAVYGNQTTNCNETDTPKPLSPYAKSKYESEKLCKEYAEKYGFNTTCLRYFNVYGNRQSPQGMYAAVVAQFKNNLLAQKPLTIYGDGKQTRDFINVADVVQANLRLALLNKSVGEVFNIGSGKSMNLFELIANLEQELKIQKTNIDFKPSRENEIMHSQANCEKYQKVVTSL
ncbi:NAD-dependent epimerase/dehydratase family protein [Candidatus Babeliales bacterium]|nr:NAD-dependent epimerase/dehydratase family protein [Candidatus Babeliales bacterium]MBY0353857.1 NAD-dependent epimerase/dehydratase family protein [Candidatus Babeliales bacterium]